MKIDVMKIDIQAKGFRLGGDKEFVMEFNNINIMAGMNASGKTFIMKMAWFSGYALQIYKVALALERKNTDAIFAEEVQKLFRYTFDRAEELTGSVMIYDKEEEEYRFVISITNGVLSYFDINIINPAKFSVKEISPPQFLSKEARTFDQLQKYLKFKKKFNITMLDNKAVDELCEFYRIYDILWFEQVGRKVKEYHEKGLEEVLGMLIPKSLSMMFAEDRELIDIKEDPNQLGMPLFIMSDNEEQSALALSSGQQAMAMMTLFN